MPATLLDRSLPSLQTGYARNSSEARNEWRWAWQSLAAVWAPALGPTGIRLIDYSGKYTVGTFNNMDPATDWVPGLYGYAVDFDNTDDFIGFGGLTPSEVQNIPAADFCITWLSNSRSSGEGSLGTVIDNLQGSIPNPGWAILHRGVSGDVNTYQASIGFETTHVLQITNDNTVTHNQWDVWSYNFDFLARAGVFYKNGQSQGLQTDQAGVGAYASDASLELQLGNVRAGTTRTFDGAIALIHICRRKLSLSELIMFANSPLGMFVPRQGLPRIAISITGNWPELERSFPRGIGRGIGAGIF